MSRRLRRLFLFVVALLFAAALTVFLARDLRFEQTPPRELQPMARWIAEHPADWLTASAISDAALDSELPRRLELWRASHELGHRVAPSRRNAVAAFVRGGLFHWYELSAADRKAVLDEAAPLLQDEQVFHSLLRPLWQLTKNYEYLRRNAPDSLNALDALRDLAASNGLFAEYRAAREAIRSKRLQTVNAQPSALNLKQLLELLPRSIEVADEPLVRLVLEELSTRSFHAADLGEHAQPLIEFAVNHGLKPLEPLAPVGEAPGLIPNPLRARLALALGDVNDATGIEVTSSVTGARDWLPYYVERALFEARRGNAALADATLRRATLGGADIVALAAEEEVARLLQRPPDRARIAALAHFPRAWSNACGPNELCDRVQAFEWVADGTIRIDMTTVQSDQTTPYVEIYVDDARVAEGEVGDARRFDIPASNELHRIEVRLVNRFLGNGVQRRVRLS